MEATVIVAPAIVQGEPIFAGAEAALLDFAVDIGVGFETDFVEAANFAALAVFATPKEARSASATTATLKE